MDDKIPNKRKYNEKYLDGYYVTDSDGKNVKQYFTPYTGGSLDDYNLENNDKDIRSANYTRAGLIKTDFTYANWNRYSSQSQKSNGVDVLAFDRVKIEKKEDYITLDVKKEKIKDTETEYISERLVITHTVQPTNFTQLYIPFDYFKRACKKIQSYYSEDNDYVGYHNFMHYWAMNGEWWWIGDETESPGVITEPFAKLEYTYLSTDFWNKFDPKKESQQHPYTDTWDHDNNPDTEKVTYAKTINW